VQITSLIAALAQVSQSSLLVATAASIGQAKWSWLTTEREAVDIDRFDLASRGPDGSLRLLWHLKFRPHLATVGALSTILMLAFPTFVQQSVAVNTKETGPLPSVGHLYRSRSATYALNTVESYDPEFPESIDVVNGIITRFDPEAVFGKGQMGATRNTWEPYTMLSICSSVEDITSSLEPNADPSLPPTMPYPGSGLELQKETTMHSKIYLPTRRMEEVVSSAPMHTSNSVDEALRIADAYIAVYQPCLDPSQDGGENRGWDQQRLAFKDTATPQFWTASKATLWPCLQTFESSRSVTGMKSTILSTANTTRWTRHVSHDNTIKYCARDDHDEEYCIGHKLMYDMGAAIYAAFNFQAERLTDSEEVVASQANSSRWAKVLLNDLRVDPRHTWAPLTCTPQTTGFNALDYRVRNIAASLSATMRDVRHGEMLYGMHWISELVIEVSLVWLIMPILLYITMTALFFTTVACGKGVPSWKSSALAVLKCTDPRNELTETPQFKRYARTTFVRLGYNGANWHLVQSRKIGTQQSRELEEG